MRPDALSQLVAQVGALLLVVVSGAAGAFATQRQTAATLPAHFVANWVGGGYAIHEILDGSHTDPVWLSPDVPLDHAWAVVAGLREPRPTLATREEAADAPGGHFAALLIRVSSRSRLEPTRGLEYEVLTRVAADGRSGWGVLVGFARGVVEVRETINFVE